MNILYSIYLEVGPVAQLLTQPAAQHQHRVTPGRGPPRHSQVVSGRTSLQNSITEPNPPEPNFLLDAEANFWVSSGLILKTVFTDILYILSYKVVPTVPFQYGTGIQF